MTRPTLTVVIPIYNEKRTVGDLLRLVAADSYPHPEEEVVVVDDANRDSTAAELRAFDRMPGFTLQFERFELCAEITARLCRRRVRIAERPISYQPQERADGKKIGWWDGWATADTLVRRRSAELVCALRAGGWTTGQRPA
jgi:cellulose synthase/poly-beta-1,6-N-acetylglucosamine synthase-like glycosyltransferase